MKSTLSDFRSNGYIILRGFFNKDEIESLYREARMIFATQMRRVLGRDVDIEDRATFDKAMYEFFEKDFDAFVNTGKTVQHSIQLHRLGTDPRIVALLKDLGLTSPVIGVRPAMQFNSRFLSKNGSKHWKLDPHQDWRSGQGSLDSVVIWFPLVPADKDLGSIQVMPGSHVRGLLKADTSGYQGGIMEELNQDDFVQTELEVGDAVVFSTLLIHQSGLNSTDLIRWSVQFRFNNLDEPTFIQRAYPMVYIYKPEEKLVTPGFPTQDDVAKIFGITAPID